MSAVAEQSTLISTQHGARVVADWPPNIDEIREVLPVTANNIFAYDEVIYNPGGSKLPPWLVEHEKVHFMQQAKYPGGVKSWWNRFLLDPVWRLKQEIPAHQLEFHVYGQCGNPRNARRVYLKGMAKRLSAPIYGNIINFHEAKRLIVGKDPAK